MNFWIVDPAKAAQLNLRKDVAPAGIITVLHAGQIVEKIAPHPLQAQWWRVDANLPGGAAVSGFVNANYLKQISGTVLPSYLHGAPTTQGTSLPQANLSPRGHKRGDTSGRAYPLDESNMPRRSAALPAMTLNIANWLAPGDPAHLRWWPANGQTYCNIYAYDFCQRMGVYLPRVWWTNRAIQAISSGQQVAVAYGTTVTELNANSLHDWLEEFGPSFGWRRVVDEDDLQQAANGGQVCVIVAKRHNVNHPGHICVVLPETEQMQAARSGGRVTSPVQSQAGSTNFTANVPQGAWWRDPNRYQSHGLWIHA